MDETRQCTATTRSGSRCKRAAIIGGTVCRMHGGAAPQVEKAAEIRAAKMVAEDEARRMVARAGVDADPIEHLLDSLHVACAQMVVWGSMVAALDAQAQLDNGEGLRGELSYVEIIDPDNPDLLDVRSEDRLITLSPKGTARVHPFVKEYNDALDRRARFAKLCIDAGIAERQVKIAEQQGQLIAQVITQVLNDLKIKRTDKVMQVIGKRLRELEPNYG